MLVRKLRKSDIPLLRAMHQRAGYGFEFPNLTEMEIVKVVEDANGQIAFVVGAEIEAQIYAIINPEWNASPHQKIRALQELHEPIAKALDVRGVKTVNLWTDPKWPAFGRHLLRLGWSKSLWPHYFRNVRRFLQGE